MYIDPRGGHNRKSINEDFFKRWSPKMAYLLGFIYADGAIEDVRKSSRTCYLHLSSVDRGILVKMKAALSSNHRIYSRPQRKSQFFGKIYICSKSYYLRIGNKNIYQDLLNLGLIPRKSLTLKFPDIPDNCFRFFLRGYFDGDGCLSTYKHVSRIKLNIKSIFTSGSYTFLKSLSEKIVNTNIVKPKNIIKNGRAYRLIYPKSESINILTLMYSRLKSAPYLERKYQKYLTIRSLYD